MRRTTLIGALAFAASSILALPAVARGTPESIVLSVAREYATPYVVVRRGSGAMLVQADPIAPHDVISIDTDEWGIPLFSTSRTLHVGETESIRGVAALEEGDYHFVCSIHVWMVGVLKVTRTDP